MSKGNAHIAYVGFRVRGTFMVSRSTLAALVLLVASNGFPLAAAGEPPEGSSINFAAKNMVATGDGTFNDWRVVASSVRPDDPMNSFVEVEVNVASIDTGNKMRDDHLRNEDFFDAETYPMAKVRVHSATLVATETGGRQRYSARFDIVLHGVEKTLDGEFVLISSAPFRVEGKLVVNRIDFGIGEPKTRWNPLSITEDVPVSFEVTLP